MRDPEFRTGTRTLKLVGRAALISVVIGRHAASQRGGAPPVQLRAATATLREDFTRVSGVRELADGRLLVSDIMEERVVVADFAGQKVEPIGRRGEGPAEYRRPSAMYALRGDSTVLMASSRWLIFNGAEIVSIVPPDNPGVAATFAGLRYADASGNLAGWSVDRPTPGVEDAGVHDSGTIIFVRRQSARIDTIAKVVRTPQRFFAWNDPATGMTQFNASAAAFATSEDFLLFPDGWLAVIRLNPYRVEWRTPGGKWIRGAPLPLPLARVTDREKAFYMKRWERAANAPVNQYLHAPAELRPALMSAARRRFTEFPEFVPPFMGMSAVPTPEGNVVIPRTPTADEPTPIYDEVNRSGQLTRRIGLAAGQRIVGFGKRSIYVSSEDSDGLEHLSRHPWP